MALKLLIKNGHVLDPSTGLDGCFDILVEDNKIKKVEKEIDSDADQIIDASGKFVMPGFIDLHVHLREPGFEYKETIQTGALAAARGGFTSICPMPNTNPVIDSKEMVEFILEKAKETAVHILPVGAVTKGQNGKELADIEQMAAAGAAAVSEDGKSVMDAALYREGMKLAKKAGIPVLAHCEEKSLAAGGVMNAGKKADELGLKGITNAVEDIVAARDILLAKETGATLHLCHCSTEDSVKFVKMAKQEGLPVTGEVCPHHFTMSDSEISEDHGRYKMNPPLRSEKDVEALKAGLKNNVMDVIATDHAPHGKEEKDASMKEAPFGIVGLETAFALTMTELVKKGYLTPMQMVEKLSYNPALVLGIEKGTLKEGSEADITIADPKAEFAIDASKFVSKGKNTPFHGKKVIGRIEMTIVSGRPVYERH